MATLTRSPKTLTEAIAALDGRRERAIGSNTKLQVAGPDDARYVVATLHGNEIVKYALDGVYVSFAGWGTDSTNDRIKQLAPVTVNRRKGETYLNGEEVNDLRAWIKVAA